MIFFPDMAAKPKSCFQQLNLFPLTRGVIMSDLGQKWQHLTFDILSLSLNCHPRLLILPDSILTKLGKLVYCVCVGGGGGGA